MIIIPAPSSYSEAAQTGIATTTEPLSFSIDESLVVDNLCPYAAHGECKFGDSCPYVHGDVCDYCNLAVLSPTDEDQRNRHIKVTGSSFITTRW